MARRYLLEITDSDGVDKATIEENDLMDLLAAFKVIPYYGYSLVPNKAEFILLRYKMACGENIVFFFDQEGISHKVEVSATS